MRKPTLKDWIDATTPETEGSRVFVVDRDLTIRQVDGLDADTIRTVVSLLRDNGMEQHAAAIEAVLCR